jgi:hypothetical protein
MAKLTLADIVYVPHPTTRRGLFRDLSKEPPFGRLTAIGYVGQTKKRNSLWACRCECGAIVIVDGTNLTRGNTTSCGCFAKEEMTKRSGRFLTFKGKRYCVNEWARRRKIKAATLRQRLRAGWPVSRALTEPPQKSRRYCPFKSAKLG